MKLDISRYSSAIDALALGKQTGRLTAIHGGILEASGCDVHQGELVEIIQARGEEARVKAEVVGLRDERILLMPLSSPQGLCLNSSVVPLGHSLSVPVGDALLGRVIDPLGEPIDDLGEIKFESTESSFSDPINPLTRSQITTTLETGVRAIDIFCTLGRGQRIGIMAGSGVGKSTLLGMMASHSQADVIVIALIGERGREVGDFIRESLGEDGMRRSVVVVAAAEQPAVLRRQAAFSATTIAEWFRKKNKNVLLIMDSITRFAMAQREIGLSTGEPIGARGYPASVFSLLPPLLERGGAINNQGSITSIYTVLVEGDDMNDPVADHMRSLLDGHVVLSRDLAAKGHYPAIDILSSISRLSNSILSEKQKTVVSSIRSAISLYVSSQDLIELGAYEPGRNTELDTVIGLKPDIDDLTKQSPTEVSTAISSWQSAETLNNRLLNSRDRVEQL